MKKRRRGRYNPKRKIATVDHWPKQERERRKELLAYGGNPEHKLSPGDYGLTPPASPRPGKTFCDNGREFPKARAKGLLRAGMAKGMFTPTAKEAWPKNIWAVADDGEAFEAQIENPEAGCYHGYPMPIDDPFRAVVIEAWRARKEKP